MTLTAERTRSSPRTGGREVIAAFEPRALKAPFALRCAALCIDYIVLISVPVLTLVLGVSFGGATMSRTGVVSNSTGWLLGALICLTNFFILPSVNGQSIGKMLTGLRIVKMDGRAISFGTVLLRNLVGYAITGLTLGLGFFLAAAGKNGRALHDLIAGTVVVYARRKAR
ncbi:MAG: RDD family protein [Acidobacteriota bacterium]